METLSPLTLIPALSLLLLTLFIGYSLQFDLRSPKVRIFLAILISCNLWLVSHLLEFLKLPEPWSTVAVRWEALGWLCTPAFYLWFLHRMSHRPIPWWSAAVAITYVVTGMAASLWTDWIVPGFIHAGWGHGPERGKWVEIWLLVGTFLVVQANILAFREWRARNRLRVRYNRNLMTMMVASNAFTVLCWVGDQLNAWNPEFPQLQACMSIVWCAVLLTAVREDRLLHPTVTVLSRDLFGEWPAPVLIVGATRETLWANAAAVQTFEGDIDLVFPEYHISTPYSNQEVKYEGHRYLLNHAYVSLEGLAARLLVFTDVTGWQEAAVEAHRQEISVRLYRDFLDTAAHEMRTPLHQISAFVEALPFAKTPEDILKITRQIDSIARRGLLLANTMLGMSKMAANQLEMQFKPVDMREVLADTLEDFQSLLATRGLKASVLVPPDSESLKAVADRTQISAVVRNLMANAVKHCRGEIVLGAVSYGRQVRVWVEDNGEGIPREVMTRLFTRWASGDQYIGGIGIGLAFVRDVLVRHDSRPEVQDGSRWGAGTTFSFRLVKA